MPRVVIVVATAFALVLSAAADARAAAPRDQRLAQRLVLAKSDLVDGFTQVYQGSANGADAGSSTPGLPCPDTLTLSGASGSFGRGFIHTATSVFLASSANVYRTPPVARRSAAVPRQFFTCARAHVPFQSSRTVAGEKQTMRVRRVVATSFPRLRADSIFSFDTVYDLTAGGRTIHARMQWLTIRYDRSVLRLTIVSRDGAVDHAAVTDLVRILGRRYDRAT